MKSQRKTIKEIEEALVACNGLQTIAAKKLGITYQAVWQRVEKSTYLQKVVRECNERNLDIAEQAIIEAINDRELTALIFYLKCKGKKRGYVERVEQEFVGEQQIRIAPNDRIIFGEDEDGEEREGKDKAIVHARAGNNGHRIG